MNDLEIRLKLLDSGLFSKFEESKVEVNLLLGKYSANFPEYTDHSAAHTLEVFSIASELLTLDEINNLNSDEIYILSMSCLLHDIGMCIPVEKIADISGSDEFIEYRKSHPSISNEEYIRDIHHLLSEKFILENWELLRIPSEKYAIGIGRVSAGHRKVDIGDFDVYEPRFFARGGKQFVCLPYLASILRIADELDVTNSRTPRLLTKYYMPNNAFSIREWEKHIATSQRNYLDGKVIFEVTCNDQNIYAALQEQFEKIQNVISLCQKVIRSLPYIKDYNYKLELGKVEPKYMFKGFDPKGIRFSFDVQNVVTAFIGEDLYKDRFTALREALQNSIDSCLYKLKVLKEDYSPRIILTLTGDSLIIKDNGAGMDEFIVENFFGKLASSFYEQEKIKNKFDAIGQFGVGVFSYFLLGEYIDIETKTKGGNTLKFRFDKDPKSYFHFFDTSTRTCSGTTLTINLKESVKHEITYEYVETYVRNVFRHIEIPIKINFDEVSCIIESQQFAFNESKEINDRLKLRYQKHSEEIKIIEARISNDDFEGVCGVVIGNDYLKSFDYIHYFDPDQFDVIDNSHGYSQVSISQKGVFVNNYSSSFLDYVIGKINIKKKVKINIDRNKFSNLAQIESIIRQFEFQILKNVFKELESLYKNDEERLTVSASFLKNYLSYSPDKKTISVEHFEFLTNSIYVKIFYQGSFQIVNLEFLNKIKSPIILVKYESEVSELLSNGFEIILFNNKMGHRNFFIMKNLMENLLDFNCSIFNIGPTGYYVFENLEEENLEFNKFVKEISSVFRYLEIFKSNSDKFILSTKSHKDLDSESYYMNDYIINYNSNLVQFIVSNNKIIRENNEYTKILKAILDYVMGLIHGHSKIDESMLIPLNEILEPFNKLGHVEKFKLNHFPDVNNS